MTYYLSEPLRELLSAIVETLDDIPAPAPSLEAELSHRLLVANRIQNVTGSLRDVLEGRASCGLLHEAEWIRRRAESVDTVTYKTRDQALTECHQADWKTSDGGGPA